jgi:multicomponent Na+:H+ antiporter subunit D
VPFFTFFAHDSGHRVKEAPVEMLLAMGITAGLCIFIGVHPDPLYAILPYEVEYAAYTSGHVIAQLQLLFFAAMAFAILFRSGVYPPEIRSRNLDFDWVYRRAAPALIRPVVGGMGALRRSIDEALQAGLESGARLLSRVCGPQSKLGGVWGTGGASVLIAIVLAATLLAYYGR